MAPAFLVMLVFLIGPALYALYVSGTNMALTGPTAAAPQWIGLTNFVRILQDGAFYNALRVSLTYLVLTGIGIWGNNIPVGWAFEIVNFVWWIGIGHAGTLISAILLLLRQEWRTSINRFAEAMTLFAVVCAGLFPQALRKLVGRFFDLVAIH